MDLIEEFSNVYLDFLRDLESVFPDYDFNTVRDQFMIDNTKSLQEIFAQYSQIKYNMVSQFLLTMSPFAKQLSALDDKLFEQNNLFFVKGIDFSKLWKEDISTGTRFAIWNYLQLLYVTASGLSNEADCRYNETILKSLKTYSDEVSKLRKKKVKKQQTSEEPEEDNIKMATQAVKSMLGVGNDTEGDNFMADMIGEVANYVGDAMDGESLDNPMELIPKLTQMMDPKNPNSKINDLYKNMSAKMDAKIESGEINRDDLAKTAEKIMPHFEKFKDMVPPELQSQMQNPQFQQQVAKAKQVDRMQTKLENKRKTSPKQTNERKPTQQAIDKADKAMEEMLKQMSADEVKNVMKQGHNSQKKKRNKK